MNSLMSMRTMAFSSSKRNSASALHSSVLPTPVGPRNRKRADRAVGVAQAGAVAPDGVGDGPHRRRPARSRAWPRRSSIFSSFSRSPSSIRVTGTPVQRLTTSAISSGVTSSFTSELPSSWQLAQLLLGLLELRLEVAHLAVLDAGGDFPVALPLGVLQLDLLVVELLLELLDRVHRPLLAFPAGGEGGVLLLQVGQLPLGLVHLLPWRPGPSRGAGPRSRSGAASSAGGSRPARRASSRSRSAAALAASSIRSIALSGRNRSGCSGRSAPPPRRSRRR